MANYNITFTDLNKCTIGWGNEQIIANKNTSVITKYPEVICECGFKSYNNDITKHLKSKTHDIVIHYKDRLNVNNKLQCERCKNLYRVLDFERHLTTKCQSHDNNKLLTELEKDFIHCSCNMLVHKSILNGHLNSTCHHRMNKDGLMECKCRYIFNTKSYFKHITTKTHKNNSGKCRTGK